MVIFLAILGFVGIGVHALLWSLSSAAIQSAAIQSAMPSDASVVLVSPSPDKKFKAVVFNQNGGGAISPYCFDYVSVVGEHAAESAAWGEELSVFVASCEAFGDWGKDIKWSSPSELQIRFDLEKGLSGINAMTLRDHAIGSSVSVRYLPKSYVTEAQ
jgi:hypothetical protein